jgi:hypothetical protein
VPFPSLGITSEDFKTDKQRDRWAKIQGKDGEIDRETEKMEYLADRPKYQQTDN